MSDIDLELEWFFNLSCRITEGVQRENYLLHLQNLVGQIELNKMNKLNFDYAIRMLPEFAGLPNQYLNIFEKKCKFVFTHIDDAISGDIFEALMCNLSGKAQCVTEHKNIKTYKDLIQILRANFGNNYSDTYLTKQLTSIIQGKFEKVTDYAAARVELALYQLINEMTKDKSADESKIISSVLTSQAQNIFVDRLSSSIQTVLRAMQLKTLDEMIKVALEEEQACNNLKPKYDTFNKNFSSVHKLKC